MLKSTLPLTLTACFVLLAGLHGATPAEIERRIDTLLARMTLQEKLGQMSQSTGMNTPLSEQIKEEIRRGRWGSFLNAGSPADRVAAQRIALQESRLRIPLIFGRDVIHGYHTIFPIPLGQAASWDAGLIEQAARVAAREASEAGIHWTFAPMLDIARDPRWGRVAEGLGEDPYLAGILGAAMVRGFQGESLDAPGSLAACAKHYVGYGAVEGGRDYNTTWIPEVLLRNVYLRPFDAARQAGVATVMTAFNDLNGIPASGNEFTLRQVLRREWKFDGVVVSDYNSITEMIAHGYAADAADAAFKGVRAGVDMEMVSTSYYDHLKELVESGKVDIKLIDEAVRDILRIKFRLGLFDKPVADISNPPRQPVAEALDLARRLAGESVVLLKNDAATLPLRKSIRRVAVIGPLADSPVDQMGTWVMDGLPQYVRTPLAALRERFGPARIAYAQGLKNSRDQSRAGFAAALEAARGADAALLFLGEEANLSGEARSRAYLDLPGAQEALVDEIAKAGRPMIAVIMAGRPLTFHPVAERVNAVLYAWHPGTMGGPAIADVLFGDTAPCGRLPITFPRTVGQIPIYYAHMNTGRPPSPAELGIPPGNPVNPLGFTSKYIDVDFTPEYPFGFGLSYARIDYSNLRLSRTAMPADGGMTISADVRNSGNHDADEVVQLYTRQLVGSITRPVRELRAFQRVHLRAGETRTVQFALRAADLRFYNSRGQFVLEPGAFRVWIAPDAAHGLEAGFHITESASHSSE